MQGPKRWAERLDPQVSGRSPAEECQAPCQLPQAQTSQIAQPCLVQTCPKQHIILKTLSPKGHLRTSQMARNCSSPLSPAGATAPAPTLKIS